MTPSIVLNRDRGFMKHRAEQSTTGSGIYFFLIKIFQQPANFSVEARFFSLRV